MPDFYSQNRCVCSTRSHGPLLCAFCLSFHFKNKVSHKEAFKYFNRRMRFFIRQACVCRHFAILPRVYAHIAPRQNDKMAAHTSLANKKRILRLKYLRSKYRLEL